MLQDVARLTLHQARASPKHYLLSIAWLDGPVDKRYVAQKEAVGEWKAASKEIFMLMTYIDG